MFKLTSCLIEVRLIELASVFLLSSILSAWCTNCKGFPVSPINTGTG